MQKRWRRLLQKLKLVGGGSSARRKSRDGPTATCHDHGSSVPHTVCPVVSRPRSGKANSTAVAENAGGRRIIGHVYHNQIPTNALTGGDTNTTRHDAPSSEAANDVKEWKIQNVHREGMNMVPVNPEWRGVNFSGTQYFPEDGRTGVAGDQIEPPYLHRGLRRRPITHTYTRPFDGMEILVKTLAGRTITLRVNPWCTIRTVKALLQEELGIPVHKQYLFFGGHHLEGGPVLADLNVKDGSIFYFIADVGMCSNPTPRMVSPPRRPTLIRFKYKDPLGNVRPIEAMSCDTIRMVKAKIQEKEGILVHDQRLMYGGTQLRDWCSLSYCDIKNQCLVYLLKGLRGGGGPIIGEGSEEQSRTPGSQQASDGSAVPPPSSLQAGVAEAQGLEEEDTVLSSPRRQEQGDEEEASDLFPLEPAVAMSHGSLQASVLAMSADVELFSVSLDLAIGPADVFVRHAIFPFLAVVLLRKTFLPLIYWVLLFLLQLRRPLLLLLNRGAQGLRDLLPVQWRSFLQEPATKAWGFVAQALKLLLLLLLYIFAPHWLNLKLKFKPDLGKISSAWQWLRMRALGWLQRVPRQHPQLAERQLPTVTTESAAGLVPASPLPPSSIFYGSCWEYLFYPPPSVGVVHDFYNDF